MTVGPAIHGKDYYISIATVDLTLYVKTSSWEVNPDVHDTSGSGIDDKTYRGGQIQRTFTMGGWYDASKTTGPGYLETIAGSTVAFERRVGGTGTGKAKQTGSLVVGKYNEAQKNDDITQWTCDFSITGPVTNGTQT